MQDFVRHAPLGAGELERQAVLQSLERPGLSRQCDSRVLLPGQAPFEYQQLDFPLHATKFQRDGRGHRSLKGRLEKSRFDISAAVSSTQKICGA